MQQLILNFEEPLMTFDGAAVDDLGAVGGFSSPSMITRLFDYARVWGAFLVPSRGICKIGAGSERFETMGSPDHGNTIL